MNKSQQAKFDALYHKHVNALKRQGKADKTIDVYARAVQRVATFLDCCPDQSAGGARRCLGRIALVVDREGGPQWTAVLL